MNALYRYNINEPSYQLAKKPNHFKKLVFGLNIFHSILQSRGKFDNSQYSFSLQDHTMALDRIRHYVNLSDELNTDIPFKAIQFLASDIFYGGHVTDPRDLQRIRYLIVDFLNPLMMDGDKYPFTSKEAYLYPSEGVVMEQYLSKLPFYDPPEILGLSEFLRPALQSKDSKLLLSSIAKLQQWNPQTLEDSIITDLLVQIPQLLDENAHIKGYHDELFIPIIQNEIVLLNKILRKINHVLSMIQQGMRENHYLLTQHFAEYQDIIHNKVPKAWMVYPSNLDLNKWFQDLKLRVAFFNNWITNGPPVILSLGAFSQPQALFAALMHQAMKHAPKGEFDSLDQFEMNVIHGESPRDEESIAVSGLLMEGARWDLSFNKLEEMNQQQQYSKLPTVLLKPARSKNPGIFCPLYRSTSKGDSNFVVYVKMQSDIPERHWVKRGVSLFTAE